MEIWVGLGVEIGEFRDQMVETGRFRFSLGKVGGVESGSYLAPWILCFAVRGYCTVRQIYFLKKRILFKEMC